MNRKQFAMIDNGWFLPLIVCLCVGVSNSLLAAFNVLDYGAKADGVHDDAPAIQAAIDAAIATGKPATVLIPKGTYQLKTLTRTTYPSRYTTDWQKPVSAHMLIANASELSIIGEPGTRLLMGVPNANGIRINHSNAVTLKQLVIDYDPLPFTQGTISNVDHQNAVFTWQRHDGFPSPTQKHFLKAARRRGSVFEAATGQLKANTKDTHFISQIQELGQDQFVFHVDRQQTPSGTAGIDPGDRFVMLARGGGAAIAMWHSQRCQAQQITVHSSPTVCFAVIDSDQMAIDQCTIKPLPGRLLSTNADGVHCKVNRTGPRVTNCNFSAMSDDAVNICGRAVMTYEQPHPDQLLVEWIEYLRTGDRVVLVDQQTGRQTVEAVIRDIKPDHWQNHRALRLTFDHPLGDVLTQSEVGSELVSNKQRAAMAAVGKKVDGRLPDLLVNLNALGSGFEI
ncbi:MAG: glycosyl hydrolase family 28-related protein, partial [Phycisphaeraceae bacterium JB051]